jgi:hypothetical protein
MFQKIHEGSYIMGSTFNTVFYWSYFCWCMAHNDCHTFHSEVWWSIPTWARTFRPYEKFVYVHISQICLTIQHSPSLLQAINAMVSENMRNPCVDNLGFLCFFFTKYDNMISMCMCVFVCVSYWLYSSNKPAIWIELEVY